MKRVLGVAVLCGVILLVGSQGSAEAGGPHGGPYGGPHGGPHIFWDIWLPPVWGPWWGPPYPYSYPAPPPVVIQQPPVVQSAPPAPAPVYWYYCPNPAGYYPYVQQCPSAWMQVVPPTTPPAP
jgi:hypothetical protein